MAICIFSISIADLLNRGTFDFGTLRNVCFQVSEEVLYIKESFLSILKAKVINK